MFAGGRGGVWVAALGGDGGRWRGDGESEGAVGCRGWGVGGFGGCVAETWCVIFSIFYFHPFIAVVVMPYGRVDELLGRRENANGCLF